MSDWPGLRWRTRGNASPQGRSRVYLSCHPDDLTVELEEVATEVLGTQPSAAIWYRDPADGNPTSEELEADLSRMQLFVVPVTSRLLYAPCDARDVELPFALTNHIPVLPLMREPGLDEGYARVFGDLQFLDRAAAEADPTAIPYDERLARYLDAVLAGDELAKRVRAAFDAYVFLSYRKRDRAEAQRIMRLIHDDPLCRDIAIWYDEFLVPGEGFNQAILNALQDCAVFALVVTPNLLEDPNYVMSEEWPAARTAGKPTVPVEAIPTDPVELSRRYAGLPDAVPAYDREALASCLARALRDVALLTDADNPSHDFLIGLAYLLGIDVETDHARALFLIEGAAEAGLLEAHERLVSMYEVGEGVVRDHRKAAEWQRRLVDLLRARAADDPSSQSRYPLLQALSALGRMQQGIGDPHGALAAFDELLTIAKTMAALRGGVEDRHNLFVALSNVGTAHLALGDPQGADELFRQSLSLVESLSSEAGTEHVRSDLPTAMILAGDTRYELGDMEGALGLYQRAVALLESLVAETGALQDRRNLSVVLGKSGDVSCALGRPAEALSQYERALAIRTSLSDETGTVQAREDLASAITKVGDATRDLGDPRGALEHYHRARALYEALEEETGTVASRRHVAAVLQRIGDAWRDMDDAEAVREAYAQSLAIAMDLAGETGTVQDRQSLAQMLARMGDVWLVLGDADQALARYEQSVTILEILAREARTIGTRRDLATVLTNLGFAKLRQGEQEEALRLYERSLAIHQEVFATTGTEESRRDLAGSLDRISKLKHELGDLEGAYESLERRLEIDGEADQARKLQMLRELALSYGMLGDDKDDQGDAAGALRLYGRMLTIAESLATTTGTVQAREDLLIALGRVGDAKYEMEDLEGALAAYERKLAIAEDLAAETGTADARRDLSVTLNEIGATRIALGEAREALEPYRRMLAIREGLARKVGSVGAWEDLSDAHYEMGMLATLPQAERIKHLQMAMAILQRLFEATGQPSLGESIAEIRRELAALSSSG